MALYIALVLGSGLMALDSTLPFRSEHTVITAVKGHEERMPRSDSDHWERQEGKKIHWSKVELTNGSTFRTERMSGNFKVGMEVEVQLTALLDRVSGYRTVSGREYHIVEAFSDDLKPFPFLVFACSSLLLLPWWKVETIWILRGVLLIGLFAWLLSVIGTSGGL